MSTDFVISALANNANNLAPYVETIREQLPGKSLSIDEEKPDILSKREIEILKLIVVGFIDQQARGGIRDIVSFGLCHAGNEHSLVCALHI